MFKRKWEKRVLQDLNKFEKIFLLEFIRKLVNYNKDLNLKISKEFLNLIVFG